MASSADLIAYIAEQLGGEALGVQHKRMFGEYGFYRDGKFFAMVCDDCFFVKQTSAGRGFLETHGALVEAPPYEGASNAFLIEKVDDAAFLRELSDLTLAELPLPKPKKTKKR